MISLRFEKRKGKKRSSVQVFSDRGEDRVESYTHSSTFFPPTSAGSRVVRLKRIESFESRSFSQIDDATVAGK